ncbi:uncharacterized protein LOC8279125 [Ricinus communis]|uniref:uncharacterized protein LOC8279125 n=1 Tax=Ricinus communis TaxID=3988 RepID=UPI00201ACAD2|nr:uncharacterized protein LOC8279125 [Ricinus communis]
MCADEDSGIDEAESAALVTISGTSYRVKEELAPIISSIINHHGFIAANHLIKSPEGRSMAFDTCLDVSWLQRRVEDILEAKKLIKQSSTLKEKRDRIHQVIKEKKIKLKELQQKVNLAQKELEIEQAEAENIKSIISNAKAKVKYFVDHLPFDGLF